MASVGPASWVGQGLKKSEGRANSVSQVDEVSDLVSACQLSEKKGPEENNGLCQHFCQGECYFSSSQLISDNSVLPCMSLVPQCWSSSKWVLVSQCVGPLREMSGAPDALHLTQPQFELIFTARIYGDFSFWRWRDPVWGWDLSVLWGDLCNCDILLIFIFHSWVWDPLVLSLCPS